MSKPPASWEPSAFRVLFISEVYLQDVLSEPPFYCVCFACESMVNSTDVCVCIKQFEKNMNVLSWFLFIYLQFAKKNNVCSTELGVDF